MHKQQGISLLELIIVISIFGILSTAMLFDHSRCTQMRQLEITAGIAEADLHGIRSKAAGSDCDCVAVFDTNGYRCEQIRIDGLRRLLKQNTYPLPITGSTGTLGFKASGSAMYAGSIYLQNTNGDQYKLILAPVTGKITVRKL
ncbi:type II secretion system protein [Candidatus Margulisiibacteriota bacterium]